MFIANVKSFTMSFPFAGENPLAALEAGHILSFAVICLLALGLFYSDSLGARLNPVALRPWDSPLSPTLLFHTQCHCFLSILLSALVLSIRVTDVLPIHSIMVINCMALSMLLLLKFKDRYLRRFMLLTLKLTPVVVLGVGIRVACTPPSWAATLGLGPPPANVPLPGYVGVLFLRFISGHVLEGSLFATSWGSLALVLVFGLRVLARPRLREGPTADTSDLLCFVALLALWAAATAASYHVEARRPLAAAARGEGAAVKGGAAGADKSARSTAITAGIVTARDSRPMQPLLNPICPATPRVLALCAARGFARG